MPRISAVTKLPEPRAYIRCGTSPCTKKPWRGHTFHTGGAASGDGADHAGVPDGLSAGRAAPMPRRESAEAERSAPVEDDDRLDPVRERKEILETGLGDREPRRRQGSQVARERCGFA